MDKYYIGIDVGAKGFITLYGKNELKFYSISDNDFYELGDIIRSIKTEYSNIVCVMEEIHAIYNSSAKATFSFGEINGLLKGLLIANKVPYHLVPPKKWQSVIWDNKDMVVSYKDVVIRGKTIKKKEVNTKQTSINSAKRLFPEVDFRKNERCKNIDDNKVDSLLIAEYGRRMNL